MMVLWFLLVLASGEDCSYLCANQTSICTIHRIETSCDSSVNITTSTSIIIESSQIYSVQLQNKGEPTIYIQLNSAIIRIEDSRLVSSRIILKGGTVSITARSVLDTNGHGYITGSGTYMNSNDGPSYGGRGGGTCGEQSRYLTYGDQFNPRDFYGSGGTTALTKGGGIIIVEADHFYLHGLITAAGNILLGDPILGTPPQPREEANGGTGGSVYINVSTSADCNGGRIVAAGGNALNNGFGGGGGRVAIFGPVDVSVTAQGGTGTRPRCHEAGAGTIFFHHSQTLLVDNLGIVTRNPTPVSTYANMTLLVRNGATITPLFSHIPLIAGKLELLNSRLEASQVAGSGLNFDSTLQINVSEMHMVGKSTLGRTDIETMNITVKNQLNVEYSSGIYFGSKLRIDAHSVDIKGEIEGNLVVPDVSSILINSTIFTQRPESVIKAERMAILSRKIIIEGSVQAAEQSCHESEDYFLKNPPYHFITNGEMKNITMAEVQTLLMSNFTQLIIGKEMILTLGKIVGSRIGLFGDKIILPGVVSASGSGCFSDKGPGKGSAKEHMCSGSGAGYGGKGGNGRPMKDQYVQTCATITEGGKVYSDDLNPWFEGSGGGSDPVVGGSGGGFIDIEAYSLLNITGMISADGEDAPREASTLISGSGGGSGGSIFIRTKRLTGIGGAKISATGGRGTVKGGGAGGGRILFSWIGNVTSGVHVNQLNHTLGWDGAVEVTGGLPGEEISSGVSESGENGTIRAETCAPGTASYLCLLCPKGFYKSGTDFDICHPCLNKPKYGEYVNDGETDANCAYRCPEGYTDVSQNKNCDSPLKEFFTMFGGIGGAIGVTLAALSLVALVALLMIHYCSKWRRIYFQTDLEKRLISNKEPSMERRMPKKKATHPELSREDLPFHEQRIWLIGDNSYHRPWCLPTTPPASIQSEVLPEQYALFANGINTRSRWFRWQHILCWVLIWVYHPLGLFALSISRKHKYQEIKDYIQRDAEEMWRKIEVRLLANSLRLSCSEDCTLAYIDIISCTKKIEQWEERPQLPFTLLSHGDGSFYHPYKVQHDDLLLQLVCAALDTDALEEFQLYIHSFNNLLRTVKLTSPLPNRSQKEFLEMRKLLGKFNEELLNKANYHVTLALFQAPLCVIDGKYVEYSLSARLNSELIDAYSDQLQRSELTRLYSFRLGLIFTYFKPKKTGNVQEVQYVAARSVHYEANVTSLDPVPGFRTASDPSDSAPFWECNLRNDKVAVVGGFLWVEECVWVCDVRVCDAGSEYHHTDIGSADAAAAAVDGGLCQLPTGVLFEHSHDLHLLSGNADRLVLDWISPISNDSQTGFHSFRSHVQSECGVRIST